MQGLFYKLILLVFCLAVVPLVGGPAERLAQANPTALASILVNNSVDPVTGAYCETRDDLRSPGAQVITATRSYGAEPAAPCISLGAGWWLAFTPETEQLPVDSWVEVRRSSPDGTRLLNSMRYQRLCKDDGTSELLLEACDGSFCRYSFNADQQLISVADSAGHSTRYEYSSAAPCPTRREDEHGHLLINALDSHGRIVSQWTRQGHDEMPILAMRAIYQADRTEVIDISGHRTLYHLGDGRVTAIDVEDSNTLYRREQFYYIDGLLHSYAVVDSQGRAWGARSFTYNCEGKCIRTTVHGDLTGKGPATFSLTKQGLPNDPTVECYSTHYCYSNDEEARLVSVNDDNGRRVTFTYSKTGDLIAKYLWEQSSLRQRVFLRYNADGLLIETIVDDGSSLDCSNLEGVTERHIRSMTIRGQLPGLGLPILVDEKYWDRDKNSECLLGSAIHSYDSKGRRVRQDLFNGDGQHSSFIEYQYDDQGRLKSTVDSAGSVRAHSYSSTGPQSTCSTAVSTTDKAQGQVSNHYDWAGRLVCKQVQDGEGRFYTSQFRYNPLGQLIEAVDIYGNSIESTYDALGRCILTRYPAMISATGKQARPETTRSYDLLDRLVVTTDANGYSTRVRYNVRGQPVELVHPDGTRERYTYALDGSQVSHRDRQGRCTHEQRDCFGRTLEKRVESMDGKAIAMRAFYQGCRLSGLIDAAGDQTLFSYDGAGRVIEATTQWDRGEQQQTFQYDANGRLKEACEKFGIESHDWSRLLLSGEPDTHVQARIVDSQDQTLIANEYLQPPQSNATIHCDINFVNALGQKVLRKTVIDALGRRTLTTYDALGHVVEVEEQDQAGQQLSHRLLRYDQSGHCVLDQVESQDRATTWTIARRYGPMHRLEELIEAVGTPFESHTVYRYDDGGRLESLVKPNGICLYYSYDGFGHLRELASSDGSVHYRYEVDASGRPVMVENLTNRRRTVCHYDSRGGLLHETLENGLAMAYTRDGKGRTIRLDLPDQSAIVYHYDAVLLRRIERQSSQGQTDYEHVYERYSPSGHVESEQLIGGLGSVSYERDAHGRRRSIQSSYWSEKIAEEGYDAAGNLLQVDVADRGGSYRMRFAYDCQGQLVGEAGLGMRRYGYDAMGNRLSEGLVSHQINRANQVIETPQARYSYDANGNRIRRYAKGQEVCYEYDALDRLTATEMTQQWRVEYQYDASHRRMSKTRLQWDPAVKAWIAQSTMRYLYEGQREIAAVDEAGGIQQLRVVGPGPEGGSGSAVALEIEGGLYAPIHDHRGSIVCLVDARRGGVAEYTRFSAFGEETLFDGDARPRTPSQAINPWRFSGKRYEEEIGLVFFGRRYYDPEIGRWLTRDPLGYVDGLNDYLFVRNNPESLIDAEGLFSLQAVWRGFSNAALEYFRNVGSTASSVVDLIQRDLHVFTDIGDTAMYIGQQLLGPRIWEVIGFYTAEPESGVFGNHEVDPRLRFSFTNGIQNTRDDAMRAIAMISELHGGVNIHYTYRPTKGWTWDCVNACLAKAGFASATAYCLADKWKILIEEMRGIEGGGTIIHYAHSLGGVETENARHLLSSDEQRMIRVFTFGSPMLLSGEGFQSATNYVSRLDFISLADPVNYFTGFFGQNENIVFVGTYWGLPFLDHALVANVYRQVLDDLGKNYRR